MKLMIINGPNLNLLGTREPDVYGKRTFEDYLKEIQEEYEEDISYFQSNSEGELVDKIQEVGFKFDGIILNAGAYTHTSVAIADAIKAVKTPVIEVHISNTAARESFRQTSYIAPVCMGTIAGFGLNSYELAINAMILQG